MMDLANALYKSFDIYATQTDITLSMLPMHCMITKLPSVQDRPEPQILAHVAQNDLPWSTPDC